MGLIVIDITTQKPAGFYLMLTRELLSKWLSLELINKTCYFAQNLLIYMLMGRLLKKNVIQMCLASMS